MVGAFFNPKGMRSNSCPKGVVNGFMAIRRIYFYLVEAKSHTEKYRAPPNWSKMSTILDNGYASPTVFLFKAWKSNIYSLSLVSLRVLFLRDYPYWYCKAIEKVLRLASSNSLTCLFIFFLWSCENLYCRVFIDRSSVVGIWCCNTLVAVNFSPRIWNLSYWTIYPDYWI